VNRFISLLLALLAWALLSAARVTAPSTLADKDQPKNAFYLLDILDHGHWAIQYSEGDDIATKPPLYSWMAAGLSLAAGRANDWTLLAPALLSGLACLLVVWALGRDLGARAAQAGYWRRPGDDEAASGALYPGRTGAAVGLLAALVWAFTYHAQRLQWTARADMPLCACILAALWASWRLQHSTFGARQSFRWVFWAAITLGLLAKGPVVLWVVILALAVECVFRRTLRPLLDPAPWFGLPLALAVFGLWLWFAYRAGGQAFWDVQAGNELVDRALGKGSRASNARPFYYYIPVFLGRFLPWSALLLLAAPRWWRERLFRFNHPFVAPAAWSLGIFLAYSIPMGKRPDYILPVFGPSAILVAALLFDWLRRGWSALGWRRALPPAAETQAPPPPPPAPLPIRAEFPRPERRLFALALVFAATGLSMALFFHFGTEGARYGDGERARSFGLAAKRIIEAQPAALLFCSPRESLVQFYLRANQPHLNAQETVEAITQALAADARSAREPRGSPHLWVITCAGAEGELRAALGENYLAQETLRAEAPRRPERSLILLKVSPSPAAPGK